ncbi:hypothetical protein ACHAWF_005322 [Thalassiosira exigua]
MHEPRSRDVSSAEDLSGRRNVRTDGRSMPRTKALRTCLLFLTACAFLRLVDVHRQAETWFERGHLGEQQRPRREARDEGEGWAGAGASGVGPSEAEEGVADPEQRPPPRGLAGLSCSDHGGPTDEVAEEMVYWKDVPSDAKFTSPFGRIAGKRKYLTFEKDVAGFNNVRMGFETMVVMAHAMGRTLVLPPSQGISHLDTKHGAHFSFEDFYHMEQVGREHAGFDIIPMKEFLTREAMTGNLKNKTTGKVSFPPGNRTDWDGMGPKRNLKLEEMTGNLKNKTTGMVSFPPDNRTNWDGMGQKPLKLWLRDVTFTPLEWSPRKCVAASLRQQPGTSPGA